MIIFGTDFDDTLYFHHQGGVREEDAKAIRRFQAAGNQFGLVTGRARTMRGLLEDMSEHKVDFDFWIFSNGAQVCDRSSRILYQRFLDPAFVREAVEDMPDVGFIFHGENELIRTPKKNYPDFPTRIVRSASEFDPSRILAISFSYITPEGAQLLKETQKRDDVIAVANSRFADFNPVGVTKGTALKALAAQIGKPGDFTAAIGDSFNDLSMLEEADVSFTFPDSPKEVQEAATYIVSGIAEAVDILLRLQNNPHAESR